MVFFQINSYINFDFLVEVLKLGVEESRMKHTRLNFDSWSEIFSYLDLKSIYSLELRDIFLKKCFKKQDTGRGKSAKNFPILSMMCQKWRSTRNTSYQERSTGICITRVILAMFVNCVLLRVFVATYQTVKNVISDIFLNLIFGCQVEVSGPWSAFLGTAAEQGRAFFSFLKYSSFLNIFCFLNILCFLYIFSLII